MKKKLKKSKKLKSYDIASLICLIEGKKSHAKICDVREMLHICTQAFLRGLVEILHEKKNKQS